MLYVWETYVSCICPSFITFAQGWSIGGPRDFLDPQPQDVFANSVAYRKMKKKYTNIIWTSLKVIEFYKVVGRGFKNKPDMPT